MMNQENNKALEYSNEALERNPFLIQFILLKAELLIQNREIEKTKELLKKANELGLDSNNLMVAKFYELMGLTSVLKGKSDEAAKLFAKSLVLNDSEKSELKAKYKFLLYFFYI